VPVKSKTIQGEPLLQWYFSLFEEVLLQKCLMREESVAAARPGEGRVSRRPEMPRERCGGV
jgi:hypothetical protein